MAYGSIKVDNIIYDDSGDVTLPISSIHSSISGILTVTGDIKTTGGDVVAEAGVFVGTLGAAATPTYTFSGDNNTGLYASAADQISITTSGTAKLTVKSDGKVGIGTMSPEGLLSIYGTAAEPATSGTTSNSLIELSSSLSNRLNIGLNTATGDYGAYIQVNDNNLAVAPYPLNLQPNGGNVGIGTSSPVSTFDCKGQLSISNGTSSYWLFDRDDSDGRLKLLDSSTSTNEVLAIDSSGKVLINTTSQHNYDNVVYLSVYGGTANWMSMDIGSIQNSDTGGIYGVRSKNSSHNAIVCASSYDDGTNVTNYYGGGWGGFGRSANILRFYTLSSYDGADGTTGTEAMRINSSGNVGIGTTSPSDKLEIEGDNGGYSFRVDAETTPVTIRSEDNTGSAFGAIRFTAGNASTEEEKMRIDSSGNVLIGTTNTNPSGNNVTGAAISSGGGISANVSWDSHRFGRAQDGDIVLFQSAGGTEGSISISGSTTSYNESSDYRLKENVTTLTDGIARIKQLQPKRFNFIAYPDKIVDGFIAHEAQAVVPEAVTGEKDGEKMQGIDKSKLVPLLTAALQEAIAKIETLETKVAALEAA